MPSVVELGKNDAHNLSFNSGPTQRPERELVSSKPSTVGPLISTGPDCDPVDAPARNNPRSSSDLVSLFKEAALAHPDLIAVDDLGGSFQLTYHELDVLSSHVACHITAAIADLDNGRSNSCLGADGGSQHVVIPILTSLSASSIVGILAVLKTGAAYVPIDCSQWSQENIATVLEAIGGSVVVYSDEFSCQATMINASYRYKIPISRRGLEVPFSLEDAKIPQDTEEVLLPSATNESALACVIFTSGTTGKPKGVMVRHDSLANYAINAKSHIDPTTGARSFLGLSISFDACNGYLFTYLVHGCTAVLADWTSSSFQDRFSTCSFGVLTPSVLGSLAKPGPISSGLYPNLKSLVLGGETPSQELLSAWQPRDAKWVIHNVYGPTEATVGVLVGPFEREEISGRWETSLLGRPIPGVCVKLRDWVTGEEIFHDPGRNVEEQEEGEMLIGGTCLAEGYWGDPERTAERFINWNGGRFYRTGDSGRWHVSGVIKETEERIVFLGRKDRTVKNRGFLVNVETEVDAAALGTDIGADFGLSGAFTVMITSGDHTMMCMLVSPEEVDTEELRSRMAERLPGYQVPDRIFATEKLPIGRTGKVDPKSVQAVLHSFLSSKAVAYSSLGSPLPSGRSEKEVILSSASETLGLPLQALRPQDQRSFMGLGGHSLAAVALSGRLRQQLGVSVQPKDILLFKTIDELVAIVLQDLRQGPIHVGACQIPVAMQAMDGDGEEATLTRAQREFLFARENTPGASVMHLCFSFPRDMIPSIKQAWKAVVESESIFQTRFDLARNQQATEAKKPAFRWEETTLAEDKDIDNLKAISQLGQLTPQHVGTSFRVFNSSSGSKSRLIWTIHHALIDGYAACLLLRKLGLVLSCNRSSEIVVPQGPSFCNLLNDIRRYQNSCSGLLEAAREFRRRQQAEIPNPVGKLELFPRPTLLDTKVLENRSARFEHGMSVGQLESLAHRFNVTPITLFYVTWAILLGRYTGSSNVVFGVVLSGREVAVQDVEAVVGPLISTQQLRVSVDADVPLESLARKLFSDMHSLMQYQWILGDVDDHETAETNDRSIHTAVVSQRGFPEHPFQEELEDVVAVTTVPVSLLIQEDWSFKINYRTDQYTHANITRLAESFNNIIYSMATSEGPGVGPCLRAALTTRQERQLLEFCNVFSKHTMVHDASAETMVDLFERAVRNNGDLVAVEKDGRGITYGELDSETTKLAQRIRQQGVAPGQVVALHVSGHDRSINWIIGILAIIKAGAVYCPLEGDLPAEMRRDRFERAEAALFLSCKKSDLGFVPVRGSACLAVEDALQGDLELELDGPTVPSGNRDPRALAYICFTSGSTGKPKGVAVEHRSVVAMQKHLASRLHAAPGVRIMQFLAVGFDGSMLEIFSAICNGATLVLRPDAGEGLFSVLRGVDVAIVTPSALGGLDPRDFQKPEILYFGGEPLSQSTLDLWAPGRQPCNYYGPTEVTMGSVLKTQCAAGSPVTIGRPLPSVRAYVLDEKLEMVPQGAIGEIVLAGVQVAQGYIGMPEETAAKFLPDTISGLLDERMYRTGDMGYWTENGELVCLDRRDRLVKIRGFRVSLGNVEEVLLNLPGVRAAATAVAPYRNGQEGSGSMLAWVTPRSLNVGQIHEDLASRLPAYARPHRIFALESLLTTRNGKLDYTALVSTYSQAPETSCPTQKLTETEVSVAKVWRSLLDLDDTRSICPSDSFTSLGGHSIRQLSLASRLSTTFGFPVPVRQVLRSETLRELARVMDSLKAAQVQPKTHRTVVDEGARQLGRVDLSPVEYEWWLKYQAASPVAAASFSVVWSCSLANEVDIGKLARAWSDVIARHEVFSSRFLPDANGQPNRVLWPTPHRPLIVVDDDIDVIGEASKAFDLSAEYLIRVKVSPTRLLVVVSHILCDLTTLRIILKEASSRYRELVSGPVVSLPKSLSYMETTLWFSRARHESLEFWSRYLKGAPAPVPDLSRTGDFSGTSRTFSFPRQIFAKMREFSTRHAATLYQTLLMGTAVTLQALTHTSDIVLGTPFINRLSKLESDAVGLFLQPLPFRLDLRGKRTSIEVRRSRSMRQGGSSSEDSDCGGCDDEMRVSHLLDQTKNSLQDILSHAMPWHQLLSHLGLELPKDGASYPIFDTVVSLHDYSVMEPLILDIDGAGPADEPPCTAGSKFKTMFEYTVKKDSSLSLRVEYRTPRVSEETVATMYKGLVGCFGSLSVEQAGLDGGRASGSLVDSVAGLRNAVLEASGGFRVPV